MTETELALIGHLMRRAGFGATRGELEELSTKDYKEIVEDLLHPARFPDVDDDVIMRYYLELNNSDSVEPWNSRWIYRMINTQRPLQEKMALFWHQLFATSVGKSEHGPSSVEQIETFRRNGLTDMKTILIDLAKDPAMLFWLDNNDNHKDTHNENWGRELLELFSMGVGNYTEQDIRMSYRAFTGWTFTQPIPLDPFGRFPSQFLYREDDHDDSEKEFLRHRGRYNGEDIVDIIVKQPATARFISRHLYNFFVADRGNNRVQLFHSRGGFVEKFIGDATLGKQAHRYMITNLMTLRLREMSSLEPQKRLRAPISVRVDGDGRMYIADYGSHRIQVYKKEAYPLGPNEIAAEFTSPSLYTQF